VDSTRITSSPEVILKSGKAVWTWPSVVAVDAGLMQIELCEEAVLRRAESVPQCTTHDTLGAKIEYISRRLWSKKLKEGRINPSS